MNDGWICEGHLIVKFCGDIPTEPFYIKAYSAIFERNSKAFHSLCLVQAHKVILWSTQLYSAPIRTQNSVGMSTNHERVNNCKKKHNNNTYMVKHSLSYEKKIAIQCQWVDLNSGIKMPFDCDTRVR
jgi:hypothetical protein